MSGSVTFDFTGTRVLVTGGTSGIGHAIAVGFADAGAEVTVTGTRAGAGDYETDLDRFAFRRVQLSDPDSIDELVASLDALDVLVNNAGANLPGGLDEWSAEGFAASVELNLVGPMRLTTACRRLLFASSQPGGASVVNLASMTAFRATTVVPGYGSAKAGVVNWTANLARRWATRGVRVNAIAPGVIDTPMTAPMAAFPELLAGELAHIPMGRLGRPDEVVGTALFLSSNAATYITGTTVAVDGGYLAG
ncbi:MAG: SDR family NAD(P)-dependent oxidoreductase [Microthrixaceae bacterium]